MKKILLDSSFLVAIFRKNDSLHQRAIENKEVENDIKVSGSCTEEMKQKVVEQSDAKDKVTIE